MWKTLIRTLVWWNKYCWIGTDSLQLNRFHKHCVWTFFTEVDSISLQWNDLPRLASKMIITLWKYQWILQKWHRHNVSNLTQSQTVQGHPIGCLNIVALLSLLDKDCLTSVYVHNLLWACTCPLVANQNTSSGAAFPHLCLLVSC